MSSRWLLHARSSDIKSLEQFTAECEADWMRINTSNFLLFDQKNVVRLLRVGGECLPQVRE